MKPSWFSSLGKSVCGSPLFKITLLVLLLFFSTSVALAQDTGYIGGTVTDKSGAAVAGADVTLRNVSGSITRTTLSR